MKRRIVAITLVALVGLLTAACFGPKPTVVSHELSPPEQPGQPWVMHAMVKNRGSGEGQVAVTARLIDPQTGTVVSANETTVIMQGHETTMVAIDLQPPTDGPFDEEVEAEYPT